MKLRATLMPAVARRLGIEPDGPHLVSECRPVEDEVEGDEGADCDEDADMQRLEMRVTPERRQLRVVDDVVGDRDRLVEVVLQRAAAAE